MSAPDLHPEELLDKAAAGTLTESERVFFDAHLSQCTVCRFELQARRDFQASEAPGLEVDNLVARALSGLPAQKPVLERRGAGWARFAVSAVVLFTTMASFAAVTGVLPKIIQALAGTPEVVPPPAPNPVRPEPVEGRANPPTTETQAIPEAPPPEQAAEVAPPPPVAVPRSQPRASNSAPLDPSTGSGLGVNGTSKSPPEPVAADAPDAGALFAMANQARISGDRPGAVKIYGELTRLFPSAEESRLAQATVGRLLLDSGDPQGALVQLDAYLQSGDATLREEVLAARATALSRLNRPRDEAAAWRALLESYPSSVHSGRAHQRLTDLESR
jgi:hypothetical protein